MKMRGKNWLLLAIMLGVLIAFSLKIAQAEDLPGTEQVNKVSDVIQNIGNPGYLKEQWINFLQTSKLGQDIYKISHYPAYLNPVWKYLLGVEFAYTSLFFVNLFVWLLVFAYISTAFTVFEVLLKKRMSKFALVLVCMVIISTLGATRGISGLIIFLVNHTVGYIFTGWWKAVIWAGLIVGWYYLVFISGHFERLMGRIKSRMEDRKQKAEVKELKEEVKKAKEEREAEGEEGVGVDALARDEPGEGRGRRQTEALGYKRALAQEADSPREKIQHT
jgi:hypothetical protein